MAAATSRGYLGCNSLDWPTIRPYQATPAFNCGLCAAYNQTMRPPQQNPVIPNLEASPLPDSFAQATAASMSDITWASGTFDTTVSIICFISEILETSPWRAYNSGAIAKQPSFAKRR